MFDATESYEGDPKLLMVFETECHGGPDCRLSQVILVAGGPQLKGNFFAEQALDEQFLTLAPQIAGRDEQVARPGLVLGKRAESHLFLRYAFPEGR